MQRMRQGNKKIKVYQPKRSKGEFFVGGRVSDMLARDLGVNTVGSSRS